MDHLTLNRFQSLIGAWAKETFPNSTVHSIVKHMKDEVSELEASFTDGTPDPVEAADILILLAQLADRMGWDLLELAERKHEINLKRTWGKPDERGVVRHVDTVDCPECAGTGESLDPRIPTTLCTDCRGSKKVPA